MSITRRDLLEGAGALLGLQALGPIAWSAPAWADAASTARRRLLVIDLGGGNDGLNTVAPRTGPNRAVYEQVRPLIKLPAESLRPLDRGGRDDGSVGMHANLVTLDRLYRDGRLAVVQGVDYPNHNYSHFVSNDIWQSGEPAYAPDSGWLGRHLDRVGIPEGQLRAVGIGGTLPLALRGTNALGVQVNSLAETHFADGNSTAAKARHYGFRRFQEHDAAEPVRRYYGRICGSTADLDVKTTGLTALTPGGLANQLLTARALMTADLGVEVVFVTTGGYDTHDTQTTRHANLLTDLDQAIEAFLFGTKAGVPLVVGATNNGLPAPVGGPTGGTPIGPLPSPLLENTLIMTFSEFGRRIGENATGTDHGAAAPMFFVGPPTPAAGSGARALVPGLHGDHPVMGTTVLPADNLAMTTDLRGVYQAVLTKWIDDPAGASPDEGDPLFRLAGPSVDADGSLTGLFTTA